MTIRQSEASQPAFTQALERVEPELAAIPESELEPVRHDIVTAVMLVLGVAPNVLRHREEVRVEVGEDAAQHIDHLEDSARAAYRAHSEYVTSIHGGQTDAMVEELTQERRVLFGEAQSLVAMKKVAASKIAALVGGVGQKDLCFDVLQLVAAFRAEWPSLSSHTAVTMDELERAEGLANALTTTLAENQFSTSPASPAAELRQRAYTYFVHTYDEVRRAMAFVRADEGDADEIAPSLSSGRTRRSASEHAQPSSAAATPPAPTTTTTTATGTPAPVQGAPSASPFVATS